MTVKGKELSELGDNSLSSYLQMQHSRRKRKSERGGRRQRGKEEEREGETGRGERGGVRGRDFLFHARSWCEWDIKTQIAFRQVTRCQKILDACCEETTIPICFWENNIFIFSFY